jgi:hypothetical protein
MIRKIRKNQNLDSCYLRKNISFMEDAVLEKLKYPVGKFSAPMEYSTGDLETWIREIESLPSLCRAELKDFTEEMLDTPYRNGGWTARQVVHHIVDSHMNGYMRFKLTLTEDHPTIRPYREDLWAQLPDSKAVPEVSLILLEALHNRWSILIRNMSESDLSRNYFHPESKKDFMLNTALALYAWHGKHHLEHIRIVKRKFTDRRSDVTPQQ